MVSTEHDLCFDLLGQKGIYFDSVFDLNSHYVVKMGSL